MNKCDGCTLCCELFEIKELNLSAFEMCPHCDGTKCTIHETRPEICRGFECVYSRMGNLDIRTRPDKIGVVFEKPSEEIFHGIIRPNTELSDDAKKQIMSFNKQGFTVFIRNGEKYTIYLAKGHDMEDMIQKMSQIARERHGSGFIHD